MDNFQPQPHLFCLRCANHFMFCQCQGLDHGQDLFYVMDPIPEHYTVMERIRRWAILVRFHPSIGRRLDATQYVNDLPASFEQDMASAKPIIANLMETYKNTGLKDTAKIMGITSKEGFEQCRKDCDYVMEHFFKGNWGYPTMVEFVFLNNAIQLSEPESFDPETRRRIQVVFESVGLITEAFRIAGQTNLNYRLEDERNCRSSK